MPKPSDLPSAWRERAEQLRAYGAEPQAIVLERAADELDAALRASATEQLDLQAAAAESGYSADHLGRLVRGGGLPNAGRKHAPKIRRADLPRKPAQSQRRAAPPPPADDFAREALAARSRRR